MSGRAVEELSDEELESQGKQAHDTRNWVFLHGTAEQFANHTKRMLQLENEYLRRHPKRTWQGFSAAERRSPCADPVRTLLTALAGEPGGRMHKLELHQLARDCGIPREVLASLYNSANQYIRADRSDRVLTDKGRDFLAGVSA